MKDPNYVELVKWLSTIRIEFSVHNDELEKILEAFDANLNRAPQLALFPVLTVKMAKLTQLIRDVARMNLFGSVISETADDAETTQKIQVEMKRIGEDVVANRVPVSGISEYEMGAIAISSYIETSPHVRKGLDAIFSGVLINMWTAFESLATDLWVKAVDLRPESLGESALMAPRKKMEDEINQSILPVDTGDTDEAKLKVDHISMNLIRDYGYSLRHSMGRMIKKTRKFGFNKLHDIKHAYSSAFGKAVIADVFSGESCDQLNLLEAIRHVVVHRGGRIDSTFLQRVKDKDKYPEFSFAQPDDLLELDAALVRRCMDGGTESSRKLLAFVDDWLTKNPGKHCGKKED